MPSFLYLFGQAACRILVPWPGIEPVPPAVEVWSPNHWTTREFLLVYFKIYPSSVQPLSCVWIFAIPWTTARQASLSIINSLNLLKLMSVNLVMPSNHLILCHPLLLPSIFPNIRVLCSESVLWVKSDTEFCRSKMFISFFFYMFKNWNVLCYFSSTSFSLFLNDLITFILKSLFFLAFIDYFISWLLVILPSFAHLIIFIVY